MLFFQIILVPLFAMTVLSAVFLIGIEGTISSHHDGQDDWPLYIDGKYDPPGRILPPL
jgi:hypothetical protein